MSSSASNFNPQALPEGTRLGDYEIISVLGGGGFGITYKVIHISSGSLVVIKENLPAEIAYRDWNTLEVVPFMRSGAQETYLWSLSSFYREAQTLSKLNHRYVVSVYEAFECYNTAYFVMPYIEGVDLLEWFQNSGTHAQLAGHLEQHFLLLLEALDHVHAHNFCHRDVKPSNIMITKDGSPLLIDFGAARDSTSEATRTVLATIGYAPIEQLESHGKIGPWTDLYALGATFYRLVTGEEPPLAISRVRNDTIRHLSQEKRLLSLHSKAFLRAIEFSMRLNEADRPQSCSELSLFITTPEYSPPAHNKKVEITPPAENKLFSPPNSSTHIADEDEAPFLSQWPLILAGIMLILAGILFVALQSRDGSNVSIISASACLFIVLACLSKYYFSKQRKSNSHPKINLTAYNNETGQIVNYKRLVLGNQDWMIILGRSKQHSETFYLPNDSHNASISRKHATIFYTGGQMFLRNESNKQPLIWNQRHIQHHESLPISPNENGQIGPYTIYFQ